MISCNSEISLQELRTGDLLFRESYSDNLSKAIDEVTQTKEANHYSHMGLVELINGTPTVLHATRENGTSRTTVHEFSRSEGQACKVFIYRLKHKFRKSIPKAIERAGQFIGKPYNFSYILSDSANYCSEYIYKAFEADSIFKLAPMTFINPNTGEAQKTWVDYYNNLGMGIPEGLPGCNPNGMVASGKLINLGELKIGNKEH